MLEVSLPMSSQSPDRSLALRSWHSVVESGALAMLADLLDDDVVFRSPAVFAPQQGKDLTMLYLAGALKVLGPTLRYIGEWHDQASAVLEFEADLEGSYVQGVDILRWNAEDKLTSFTVLVRPLRGLEKLIALMSRELTSGQP